MTRAILTAILAVLLLAAPRAAETIVGFYAVSGAAGAGKSYTGLVEIIATGHTYHLRWQMAPNGDEAFGVGLLHKDILIVGFYAGPMLGIVRYQVKKGVLTGVWSAMGSDVLYTEVLTKLKGAPPASLPRPPIRHPQRVPSIERGA